MKKIGLKQRILNFLKGGDEAKTARFITKEDKYLNKQISNREDEIETVKDKIEDAKESLKDSVLNVDINRVLTTEGAEGYCSDYTRNVDAKLKSVESLEARVEELKKEIARFKKLKGIIFEEVDAPAENA